MLNSLDVIVCLGAQQTEAAVRWLLYVCSITIAIAYKFTLVALHWCLKTDLMIIAVSPFEVLPERFVL